MKKLGFIVVLMILCVMITAVFINTQSYEKVFEYKEYVNKSEKFTMNPDAFYDSTSIAVYKNRLYTKENTFVSKINIKGEFIGSVTTELIINGYDPKKEVELGCSGYGDFYTVKGFNSDYLICSANGNRVTLYYNLRDEYYSKGADIYEDMLGFGSKKFTFRYESMESFVNERDIIITLPENYNYIVQRLVKELEKAPFITEDDFLNEGETINYTHVLTLVTEEGVEFNFHYDPKGYLAPHFLNEELWQPIPNNLKNTLNRILEG